MPKTGRKIVNVKEMGKTKTKESTPNFEEMLSDIDQKIDKAREAKLAVSQNIRTLEGYLEACNEQIERLIELKWSTKMQAKLKEIKENVFNR